MGVQAGWKGRWMKSDEELFGVLVVLVVVEIADGMK
jgi:hypothetical protein